MWTPGDRCGIEWNTVANAARRNEVYQSGYCKNQFSEARRTGLSLHGSQRRGRERATAREEIVEVQEGGMKRRNMLKILGLGATTAILAAPATAQAQKAEPEAALAPCSPWPAPRSATAGTNALLGHCRVGSGPAVCIVLHEWLGDHVNWEQALSYFDFRRHTLLFVDLRGYGWSRGLTGRFALDEATDDVLRLADELQIPRFHLVGHSMSGLIAQEIALSAPSRIPSVTLFSPVPPTGFHADDAAIRALSAVVDDDEAASRAINSRTSNRYGSGFLQRKLRIARGAATPEAMRGYLKMFTTSAITNPGRLTGPLHVVSGAQDIPFYRNETFRGAFAAAYPQATFEIIDDAGHYTMLETPVRVASIIEKRIAAAT
jgi:pimeloyl-ACP methyl ester carboxylesterase